MDPSKINLSQPIRQSPIAVWVIIVKRAILIIRQIFPLLLIILIGKSENKSNYFITLLIGLSIFSAIYAIINYFRTYFYIKDNEIILHTGVFRRKYLSLPFDKIQTINLEQNFIFQIFNVKKISIDSAGTEIKEFEFHALPTEIALQLQNVLLDYQRAKAETYPHGEVGTNIDESKTATTPGKEILELNIIDVFKIGLSQNHLKSFGLILVFLFWIVENLNDAGVKVEEYQDEIFFTFWNKNVYLFLIIAVMFISVFISLIRSVLEYSNLVLERIGERFRITSGLFNIKEVSARDQKIQFVSWNDNILKRWFGIQDVYFSQAQSGITRSNKKIVIPGCTQENKARILSELYADFDSLDFDMHQIDKRFFTRFATILSILIASMVCILVLVQTYYPIIFILLFGIYLILTRYLAYKKAYYALNDKMIFVKGGVFGNKGIVLPTYKIQNIAMSQTPFQYRKNLASIQIYTAGGNLKIPYIDKNLSQSLINKCLYIVEKSKTKWM